MLLLYYFIISISSYAIEIDAANKAAAMKALEGMNACAEQTRIYENVLKTGHLDEQVVHNVISTCSQACTVIKAYNDSYPNFKKFDTYACNMNEGLMSKLHPKVIAAGVEDRNKEAQELVFMDNCERLDNAYGDAEAKGNYFASLRSYSTIDELKANEGKKYSQLREFYNVCSNACKYSHKYSPTTADACAGKINERFIYMCESMSTEEELNPTEQFCSIKKWIENFCTTGALIDGVIHRKDNCRNC